MLRWRVIVTTDVELKVNAVRHRRKFGETPECSDQALMIDTLVGRDGSVVVLVDLSWRYSVAKGWKHSQGESVNVHQASNKKCQQKSYCWL